MKNLEQIDMTCKLESAEAQAVKAAVESRRFDHVSIGLHWLTVLLILGQFTSAWVREGLDHDSSLAVAILATHRTMGLLTWIVGLARLAWRHNLAYLPPFPPSMPKLQQSIARGPSQRAAATRFLGSSAPMGADSRFVQKRS